MTSRVGRVGPSCPKTNEGWHIWTTDLYGWGEDAYLCHLCFSRYRVAKEVS